MVTDAIISTKVRLTVSPLRTLLLPLPSVYSQPFAFPGQTRNVSHALSYSCRLFFSLGPVFRARFVCFQQLADSFCKMPGVGRSLASRTLVRGTRSGISSRRFGSRGATLLGERTPPFSRRSLCALSIFRINTCKSVSKQTTLTLFRINTYEKPGEGGGLG